MIISLRVTIITNIPFLNYMIITSTYFSLNASQTRDNKTMRDKEKRKKENIFGKSYFEDFTLYPWIFSRGIRLFSSATVSVRKKPILRSAGAPKLKMTGVAN